MIDWTKTEFVSGSPHGYWGEHRDMNFHGRGTDCCKGIILNAVIDGNMIPLGTFTSEARMQKAAEDFANAKHGAYVI
jgi:hypothetical protein